VDPYTLGVLAKVYFNGNNDNVIKYVDIAIRPEQPRCGSELEVHLTIRNEGIAYLEFLYFTINLKTPFLGWNILNVGGNIYVH